MAVLKRTARRRTSAAVAEDLRLARAVGGLQRAGEDELHATIDWLRPADLAFDEEPLDRARELLRHYVRHACKPDGGAETSRRLTERAAAASLGQLLLRPATDGALVLSVRRSAIAATGGAASADAVRHQEDKLIDEIAAAVAADLRQRSGLEPTSIEAALHALLPRVADFREELHDFLCLTFLKQPPADPREAAVYAGFYRQGLYKAGKILLACAQLNAVGLRSPDMSQDDSWFVARARNVGGYLFNQGDDRRWVLEFMRSQLGESEDATIDQWLSTGAGRTVSERWIAWTQACYPVCAYERSTDVSYMCSPHTLLTLLREIQDQLSASQTAAED